MSLKQSEDLSLPHTGSVSFSSKHQKTFFVLLFAGAFCWHLFNVSYGWNSNITGYHEFRQAQTALSAFYLKQTGFRLDYLTPIFGPPWSFPLEFPLSQWLTAQVSEIFSLPLLTANRALNLASFYATLVVIFFILRRIVPSRAERLFCLSLIVTSPAYIYWTRAILIDPLAIFFAFAFLVLAREASLTRSRAALFLGALAAICCGLIKITTLITFFVPVTLLLAADFVKPKESPRKLNQHFESYFSSLVLILVPLSVAAMWSKYAEGIRAQNPLGTFLNSSSAIYWNLGTLEQRTSLINYGQIWSHLGEVIGTGLALLICAMAMFVGNKLRAWIAVSLFCALAGIAIFFNVYLTHDYYFYTVGIFILIAVALSMLSLLQIQTVRPIILYFTIPVFVVSQMIYYTQALKSSQVSAASMSQLLGSEIKSRTKTDDVILVYGAAWDPALAFYSERYVIMNYVPFAEDSAELRQILDRLPPRRVAAVVVRDEIPETQPDAESLSAILLRFGLSDKPAFAGLGMKLYLEPQASEIPATAQAN